jgi:hypothetical protein
MARYGKAIDVERAEKIFTLKGLFTQVLPVSVVTYAVVVVGCLIAAPGAPAGYIAAILVAPPIFIVLPQIGNFNLAKECHFELKARYGDRYLKMIENGEVPLSGYAVSIMRSPCSYKKTIENLLK